VGIAAATAVVVAAADIAGDSAAEVVAGTADIVAADNSNAIVECYNRSSKDTCTADIAVSVAAALVFSVFLFQQTP